MRRGCRGRERESYRLVLPREREREGTGSLRHFLFSSGVEDKKGESLGQGFGKLYEIDNGFEYMYSADAGSLSKCRGENL